MQTALSRQLAKQLTTSPSTIIQRSRYPQAVAVPMLESLYSLFESQDLMGSLKQTESKLMEIATRFGDRDTSEYQMTTRDTAIPTQVLPLNKKNVLKEDLQIHSLKVTSTENNKVNQTKKQEVPLVILHGYMNGALYFYRNVVGLSQYFDTVYSLDTPGCGLSTRAPGLLSHVDNSVEATEEFFVESLEAWRKANGLDKMILAGHSMGGYLSVAYCEKYPERVEQLVLLSPVGVPKEDEALTKAARSQMSWTRRSIFGTFRTLFDYGVTPAGFSRKLPASRSRSMIESYVQGRLPVITDIEEQQAVTDYLYYLAMVPGFGEDMLSRFLRSNAYARKPTVDRIPKLRVPKVSFLYGDHDWMDIHGGMEVYEQCKHQTNGPQIEVYQLPQAGHLLMVDNWRGMHAGIVAMCGGLSTLSPHYPMPMLVRSTTASS
jgi:cardiolipin-specific phospholipase